MFNVAIGFYSFMGMADAVGECTVIGYLKGFPHKLVGDFVSGAGFAGPLASLLYLALES